MKKIYRGILMILFLAGMVVGITKTEAGYTNYSYPYQGSYTTYPVFNANGNTTIRPYQYNPNGSNYGIAVPSGYYNQVPPQYGNYQNYYTSSPGGYTIPHRDAGVINSYNTQNLAIDYNVDNKHYYDYKYNYNYAISNSYNTTNTNQRTTNTQTTTTRTYPANVPTKTPIPIQLPRPAPTSLKPPSVSVPPIAPPSHQCRSGEAMVRSKAQCHQGYGAVCYQRPDAKRCTKQGTTRPPEECDKQPKMVCTAQSKSARGDKYMSQLGLTIPQSLEHIQQYRIQWFNGTWSKRYTPGDSDIDWKNNCNNGQNPTTTNCSRRVRSYFDDHSYQIKTCSLHYPDTNTCVRNQYYYHAPQHQTTTKTQPSKNQSAQPTRSAYTINKYSGPSTYPDSSKVTHRSAPSDTLFYGRDKHGNYFANPVTFEVVDIVNNTFR